MTNGKTLYAAKMRDGTYRCVDAISWKDAKQYFGARALSIRKRVVSLEIYFDQMFNPDLKRQIYEAPDRVSPA